MKLSKTLIDMIKKFGLVESETDPASVTDKVDYEKSTIDSLDRSAKFDEIDTVTFGLETDDGKIIKVYVNAEQSEDFEKALADKLGEIDDIEEVLNALAKDFEIVDVVWPEKDVNDEDEDSTDSGAAVMDPNVYPDSAEEVDPTSESLIGENAALQLLEGSSIENRLVTSTQLMVYHAIVDLGVPEIALARSAYRSTIIKGIKEAAEELQNNPSMKLALKSFIKRATDFEAVAKQNSDTRGREDMKDAIKDRAGEDKVKTEEPKPIKIKEDRCNWDFTMSDEDLKISCNELSVMINSEEIEKLMKGVSNRDAVVVKDADDQKKKVVFSPRGSNLLVKLVGSSEGYMMTNKDVDELLDTIAPEKVTEGFQKHMVGKFSKNGETFYLWQNNEGGYSYQLTKNQTGKFAKVKSWEESLEDVQAELKKQGYKAEKLEEGISDDKRISSDDAIIALEKAGAKNIKTKSSGIVYFVNGRIYELPHKDEPNGSRTVSEKELNVHLSYLK